MHDFKCLCRRIVRIVRNLDFLLFQGYHNNNNIDIKTKEIITRTINYTVDLLLLIRNWLIDERNLTIIRTINDTVDLLKQMAEKSASVNLMVPYMVQCEIERRLHLLVG